MSTTVTVFLRNDDVRATLDESLIQITNLLIKYNIPISHAVEPANVSSKVVDWLLERKLSNPNLIEIIQHGYNHQINYQKVVGGKLRKGEFGGSRSYMDELETLSKGKELMNNYFSDYWTPIISFPFGAYNSNTIQAANDLMFIGLSSSVSYSKKSAMKDRLGRALGRDILISKRVSYHNLIRKNTSLFELNVSVNLIQKYLNELEAKHFSVEQLVEKFNRSLLNSNVVGILLHHRYHSNFISDLERFLVYLKNKNYNFLTMQGIINEKTK